MKPVAAYMVVTDMARSVSFYNELFGKTPLRHEPRYTCYDLDGFYFGLFDATHDNETITRGNNQVLCFQVDNLVAAYERIKIIAHTIDTDLFDTDYARLFQFTDPDGNRLEIFEEKIL